MSGVSNLLKFATFSRNVARIYWSEAFYCTEILTNGGYNDDG